MTDAAAQSVTPEGADSGASRMAASVGRCFVSYAREDQQRVITLVERLRAAGLSVFWDHDIGGGELWRERIVEQLDAASCVVVAAETLREALTQAAHSVRLDAIQLLIDHGAPATDTQCEGASASLNARRGDATDQEKTLRFFLDRGCEPRAISAEQEPLIVSASTAANPAAIKLVLEHGDPIDHKEADGRTALSRVASAGSPEIAKLLLSLDASADLKDNLTASLLVL